MESVTFEHSFIIIKQNINNRGGTNNADHQLLCSISVSSGEKRNNHAVLSGA
jgi:hypothetical protein